MEKENKKYRFGLVGKDIAYSFSKGYFTDKFAGLELADHSYENFDMQEISELEQVLQNNKNIAGLNVTIPYKEQVMPYLSEIDHVAKNIGAVNTIKFTKNGLIGFNTDAYGFEKSIAPFLQKQHTKALILGTGGASKAVTFVLESLNIACMSVSRNPKAHQFSYSAINEAVLAEYTVLVNCTPLGTHPNIEQKPDLPYQHLNEKHLLFDLIYNPEKTAFLKQGEIQGATICNGHKMLKLQAEKAWQIWND